MLEKVFASSLIAVCVGVVVYTPTQATTLAKPAVLLTKLKVEPETASKSYKRSYFKLWIDADHNGCNTREEVLISEGLTNVPVGNGCAISSGRWTSAYDVQSITAASRLDIDHMVPLHEAWESGAWKWNAATRQNYANDLGYPHSLIAVSAATNRAKGDQDPDNWMPPSAAFGCQYVGRWVAVKYRWSLSVDQAEKSFLAKRLKACGSKAYVVMPTKMKIVLGKTGASNTVSTGAGSAGGSGAGVIAQSSGGNDPRYSSCTKAKAAGYGPYHRGVDPEYSWYVDRDNDGIACE